MKLKEIGYPQDTYFWWNQNRNRSEGYDYDLANGQSGDQGNHVACPSTDELLDWLGDDLEELYHDPKGEGWFAYSTGRNKDTSPYLNPTEAVYNLILAIHQYDPLPHPDSEGKF